MTTSPSDIPDFSFMNPDELRAAAENALKQQPPEVQAAVEKGKSFYAKNRPIILTGVALYAVMRVNKRMVRKATVKAVAKELVSFKTMAEANGGATSDLPNMFDILESLRETPGMAYIPHGGGMVHLLKGKDAIVTVFGEFENMTNQEIWNQVANILNLNVRV